MTYKEFNFLDLQEHNEATVVIEVQPVSGSSPAPFVSVNQLETGCEIAEE